MGWKIAVSVLMAPLVLVWIVVVCVLMIVPMLAGLVMQGLFDDDRLAEWSVRTLDRLFLIDRA